MDAKLAFVLDVLERGLDVETAAKLHGVGRTCGYKWLARYREYGVGGLEDLSRAPYVRPTATSEEKIRRLLRIKRKHPDYGPAKLVAMLEEEDGAHFLAVSTAGEILARHGKVQRRGPRRRRAGPIDHPPFIIEGAGHSMTTDYKGQFRMVHGRPCYPLTIADPFSRYVFDIRACSSTSTAEAKPAFERVFREHGVPAQIISDNGTPFCSTALGGLTELSKWWIQLGSTPVRIDLGSPQQNGRHERMHRTLKDRIRQSPRATLRAQQRMFDSFRLEYNHVRPHQSLGQKPPVSMLKPYTIEFTRKVPPVEYSTPYVVRTVRSNGQMKWAGGLVYVSEVLCGEPVGLLPLDDGLYEIYYAHVRLGYLDERTMRATNTRPAQTQANDDDDEPRG